MHEFIRRYLVLRDGNLSPVESWAHKHEGGKPSHFELSFREPMEGISRVVVEEALQAAAVSGSVYAHFYFRYKSPVGVFRRCDGLLDNFFLPLRRMGVIGHAVPPYRTLPQEGMWCVELFPIEAVPESQRGILTPKELLRLMVLGSAEVPVH